MAELRFLSRIEQAAAFLRAELAGGLWEGAMPGRVELAAELGLNEWTVENALRLLEKEGAFERSGRNIDKWGASGNLPACRP